ncbi:MAG: DnaA/Hda family protein [Planctomycetota bacterium]
MEALKSRIGEDRYRMWFSQGVGLEFETEEVSGGTLEIARMRVIIRGQFALDRIRQHFLQPLRGAVMQTCGQPVTVELTLFQPPAAQSELPLDSHDGDGSEASGGENKIGAGENKHATPRRRNANVSKQQRSRGKRRRGPQPLASLVEGSAGASTSANHHAASAKQLSLPECEPSQQAVTSEQPEPPIERVSSSEVKGATAGHSVDRFIAGPSNKLAYTAMAMVCQDPRTASPLFLCGPTGTGKTHLLSAIAEQFRRRHRMRRVMQLSAEQFTNDFVTSVGNSGITAFRRRYREVDALLIDDVQFLGAKKATLREMLYTVETLASAGRPLVFSGLTAPTEIRGLSSELSGRMAAGLVCGMQPLDSATREVLLRRMLEERCVELISDEMIEHINATLTGDGRVISGVVNVINTLQRMSGRNPTMDELRRYAGQLLRSATPVTNLTVIESAVCEAFQLEPETLRGGSQTRAITEPRMLAMYLSRQLTSAAYSQIAKHFGGKSHSTAISAENNIKSWLASGKAIGRGPAAMSVQEAIDRVEGLLRSG